MRCPAVLIAQRIRQRTASGAGNSQQCACDRSVVHVDAREPHAYLRHMPASPQDDAATTLVEEWTLSPATTLGSSVRAKGILLELRARLPLAARKSLEIRGVTLALRMPGDRSEAFESATATIGEALQDIESLPIIPREIEDILAISTTERHRWLKDGRLPSAGTRTVKLRGRAKQITFHVFDPRQVEEVLNNDLVAAWREADAETAAENRRRAAWKAKLTRSEKAASTPPPAPDSNPEDASRHQLQGWAEFERDGLLR
jgi:hypothetical protein